MVCLLLALALIEAQLKSGHNAQARVACRQYLVQHPRAPTAELLLGVAEARLGNDFAAADAFGLAGAIPPEHRNLAVEAYTNLAIKALNANEDPRVVDYAGRALALRSDLYPLYLRGTARNHLGHYAAAIADLEQARALGQGGRGERAILDAVDGELITAYLRSGQIDKGLAVPRSSDRCDHAIADYFNQQATVHSQAGRNDLAGAELEAEARALPSQAAELYVQAASALSSGGNWKRVLADAQLALAAHPDHPRATFLAGLATFRLGDKEQGRAQLLRARGLGDSALRSEVDAALRVLR